MTNDKVRIDKFLWAIRAFKTRSLAAEACDGGKVKIDKSNVKPSRIVKLGETIHVKTSERERVFEVVALLEHRVGAALVSNYVIDKSEPMPDTHSKVFMVSFGKRTKGEGRPTKKERRDIDLFIEEGNV